MPNYDAYRTVCQYHITHTANCLLTLTFDRERERENEACWLGFIYKHKLTLTSLHVVTAVLYFRVFHQYFTHPQAEKHNSILIKMILQSHI